MNNTEKIIAVATRTVKAAKEYDGSSAKGEKLVQEAAIFETLLVDEAKSKRQDYQLFLQEQFSGATAKHTPEEIFDTAIARVENQRLGSESLNELLETLKNSGAVIEHCKDVLIRPINRAPNIHGEGKNSFNIETRPRLALLVNELQNRGIYSDHLKLQVSELDPKSMRKHPYILVNIYDKAEQDGEGIQIAICEQVGQISFVCNHIYPPSYYKGVDKTLLRALPGMHAVRHVSDEGWLANLLVPLDAQGHGLRPEFAKAVKPKIKHKIILSESLIEKLARDEIKNTGNPLRTDDEIYLPDGTTGGAINNAFWHKGRGLGGTLYRSLPEFLEGKGLSNKLIEEMIEQLIKDYIAEHKEPPSRHSKEDIFLPNGIKLSWSAINASFRYKGRGLEDTHYSSLAKFLEAKGLSNKLSEEMIEQLTKDYIAEHKKPPSTRSKEDIFLPNGLKTSWNAIDASFYKKYRGLEETHYSSLHKFIEAKGLHKSGAAFLQIIDDTAANDPDFSGGLTTLEPTGP